jgi:hypothetical protein
VESPYAAMTVNERLFASGRMVEWDEAVQARDRERMITILLSVDMGQQAQITVDRILEGTSILP